jgi:hypothetical protein
MTKGKGVPSSDVALDQCLEQLRNVRNFASVDLVTDRAGFADGTGYPTRKCPG